MKTALVILILAIAGAANSANLLGATKCTYGPSYWCENFQNAAECSTTKHCVERVWSKDNVTKRASPQPFDDSSVCTFCQDMIGDVKSFVENNQTRATILQYMNRACDFMPDEFSLNKCKEVEQHYLDEFLDLIKNNVDPQTICKLAGLCNNKTQPQVSASVITPAKLARVSLSSAPSVGVKSDAMCDACKSAVAMAKQEVDNKDNQDKMKALMENECQQLGGDLAAECKSLVDMFLPQIISALDKQLTPELCVAVKMCNSTTSIDLMSAAKATFAQLIQQTPLRKHISGVASRVSADECTICEEIINYVKLFVNNNQTEQQVVSLIENDVCSQLGSFASMCKEVVEQYFPQVWSEFISVLDPKTLCTDLHLCNSTVVAKAPEPVKVESSVQCVMCEFLMRELESKLVKNATEQQIEQAVEKVCAMLPASVKDECDKLVEQYGPQIIKLLVNDAAPATVCGFLGLCGSSQKVALQKLGDSNCMMCELAMNYAKSAMQKNATDEEILKTVEQLCKYLGSMEQECDAVIEQYGPSIIKSLANDIDAKTICTQLGLCTAVQTKSKVDGLVHLSYSDRARNV